MCEALDEFDHRLQDFSSLIRCLLLSCRIRNLERLDEVNAAFDVMVLGWRYSTLCDEFSSDIEWAAVLGSLYQQLRLTLEETCVETSDISMIRDELEDCEDEYTDIRKSSNQLDFMYSQLSDGHTWRSQISPASLDTLGAMVACDVVPREGICAMLLFIMNETGFTAMQVSEFFVHRFRSRLAVYDIALKELSFRLTEDGLLN